MLMKMHAFKRFVDIHVVQDLKNVMRSVCNALDKTDVIIT